MPMTQEQKRNMTKEELSFQLLPVMKKTFPTLEDVDICLMLERGLNRSHLIDLVEHYGMRAANTEPRSGWAEPPMNTLG